METRDHVVRWQIEHRGGLPVLVVAVDTTTQPVNGTVATLVLGPENLTDLIRELHQAQRGYRAAIREWVARRLAAAPHHDQSQESAHAPQAR